MMRIDLNGGFGEKGRTSVAIRSGSSHVLFDAGIKVGASGRDYYPMIADGAGSIDALLLSHAHEDHVGALSWLLSKGFDGRILMTEETLEEAPATLRGYADPGELEAFPFPRARIELFSPGDSLAIGDLSIRTGRSGHVAGGVWFAIDDGTDGVVYSADVLPDSQVFVMDPIPACDLLILDASYGADPISCAARAEAIGRWIGEHAGGCLLPTPLFGRSLELLAVMPERFAIAASMRPALEAQLASSDALHPKAVALLRGRLAAAIDWPHEDRLPDCPLLADDGMGASGPSARLIPFADAGGYPVLLTGHLPERTPGYEMEKAGRAAWIRMPTHPTLSGNVNIWRSAGKPTTLGHSCSSATLAELHKHIPTLKADASTGQSLTLSKGRLA